MPFGIGFWANTVSAAPATAGSYELIETISVGTAVASVTFSSLGTYSTTYKHLQIRYTARDTGAFDSASINVQLNGVTSASYAWHSIRALMPSTVQSTAASSTTSATMALFVGGNGATGNFGAGVIDFLDAYSSTKNTTMRCLFGHTTTDARIGLNSGLFNNTAAMTQVNLATNGSGFAVGSRFSLYGIKA